MDMSIKAYPGSNCTFMELKFVIVAWSLLVLIGSNCTFMELKFDSELFLCSALLEF